MFNMTRAEYEEEKDLFMGDLNRICVTEDKKELLQMYNFARKRLERIYRYNYAKLDKRESAATAAGKENYIQQELFGQDK